MKFITIALFVLLSVALVCGYHDKNELKKLKADMERKIACMQGCTTEKYEPICAGKNGEKPRSFGSQCVLNSHNCYYTHDTLQKISDGECPGSEGIRLS